MSVRQDQVQLDIRFVTDESRALAKSIVDTKQYNEEIRKSQTEIKKLNDKLKEKNISEERKIELTKLLVAEEVKIAKGLENIAKAGKSVQNLDLTKVAPAQLIERAKLLSQQIKNIPQSAPQFKELQEELGRVNQQIKKLADTAKGVKLEEVLPKEEKSGGFFSKIAGFAATGARAIPIIGGIVAGVRAVGGALSGANKLEQLTLSFETFLGSAEKAKAVIADLKDFEVKTPFEADQVNKAGRSLLAFGFTTKELIPTLTRIGDVASGTGKDFNELALIYGKAKTQGRIQGEELNQLAEAGIPIYGELAKVLNVNENQIRKLGEQGRIQFSDLEQVFQNLTGEGGKFGGLMEAQSKSLGGLYSTLKSSLGNLLTQIGTALAPLAKGALEAIIGVIGGISKAATPLFNLTERFFKFIVSDAKLFRDELLAIPGNIATLVTSFEQIPYIGKAFTALLAPMRLVRDAFESLSATASGLMAGIRDVFENGGRNAGKAYTEARNKVLDEERAVAARDKAEAARDDLKATKEETAAIVEQEKKTAAERAERQRLERDAAQKRADAALEAALKAVEVHAKRQELYAENAYFKGEISEETHQQRIFDITKASLEARLDVFRKFHRELSVEALEAQNALEAAAAQAALKGTPVSALPSRQPGQVDAPNNKTGQDVALGRLPFAVEQSALKDRFENLLITEQEYELKRLELKRAALDEEVKILANGSAAEKAQAQKKGEELLQLDDEISKKKVENAQRSAELKRQVEQAGYAASADFFSLAADLLQQDERTRKKHASTIKAFQTAQVLTNGVLEVQKIWASVAEYGPAAPIIGGVLTAVAVGRSILAISKINKAKFAGGGYTGTGYGSPDSTGYKPAGVVHEGEYVAPKWQVNDPQTAPVIRWLESRRLRGYASGGFVTVNTTPSSVPPVVQGQGAVPGMDMFMAAVRMFTDGVAAFPRSVTSSVVLTDLEARQGELDKTRKLASI